MRQPDDKHFCPLMNREVFWGDCYEVQEVREDNMDMELLIEPVDIDQAAILCEKCKWYFAAEE